MEDKDLDRYFKDRSGSFNEAPDEGLWAKIEANIEPPAQGGFKAGKWLLPGAGIVVVAGLVAAWLVNHNSNKTPVPAPQHPKETVVITNSVAPVANKPVLAVKDTIAPVFETQEVKTAKNQVTVKEPAPALENTNAAQTDEFDGGEDTKHAVAASQVPLYTYKVSSGKDTVSAPAKKSIAYTTEHNKGKDAIDITITQKITPAERRSLIKNTVEKNAPYIGRTITINAKGYRIYRHTITQADYNKFGHPLDTLSPKLNLKVVTDTVFYDLMQDTLQTESVKFKIEPKPGKKE